MYRIRFYNHYSTHTYSDLEHVKWLVAKLRKIYGDENIDWREE